ncbi:MAG: nucleoside deaminase [Verrucomicrobiota bacterium]
MNEEVWMKEALNEAQKGLICGEPPFGCLVVSPAGDIVVRSHDRVISDGDMSSHAETIAVRETCRIEGTCQLAGYQLVTTVEPCAMCFTTAWLNGITRIVYGATMQEIYEMTGGQQREMPIPVEEMNKRSGNTVELVSGIRREECIGIFQAYQFPPSLK